MKHTRKKRRFRHLRKIDREEIAILLGKGYRKADIARTLGVSKSAVSREVKGREKNNGIYDPRAADHKAQVARGRSKYQGMKVEALPPPFRERIVEELERHRSPDEIAGRINREAGYTVVGKDALYRWLYSSWGNKYTHFLCTKRRRRRKQKKEMQREMIPRRISLSMRPTKGVHGEGDCFVSPRKAHTPASAAAVVEQASKYLWGTKLRNRKPAVMARAMRDMGETLSLDDLTLDNGIENKDHHVFGLPAFFCDPRSPWQKPLVEQTIGLLRRWFIPKGTDLRTVSEEELQAYIAILNGKYRKSLGYRSAYEAAREYGILKTKKPAEREENKGQRVTNQRCI